VCVKVSGCVWSAGMDSEWISDQYILVAVLVCLIAVVAVIVIIVVIFVHQRKKSAIDQAKNKPETAQLVPQQSQESIWNMIEGTGSGSGRPFLLFTSPPGGVRIMVMSTSVFLSTHIS